jgi:sporulation protein YlmC with PRC-barrel domain
MTKLSVMLTTAAVLALPFAPAAFAADEKKPAADDKRPARSTAATDKDALRSHPGGLIEAKWLVGSPVRNADGQDMGKIEEVWLDPKSGQVKEAVISVGGFLGIGDKHKLVQWKDLNVAWKDQKLVVVMDQNALRDAPRHDRATARGARGSSPSASPATGK